MSITAQEAEIKGILAACNQDLRDNVQKAVAKLVELALDDSIDPKHQLKAIDMIMVRVLGKPADKIEISSGAPWESAIAAALVPAIIDVDVIEEVSTPTDLAGQAVKRKKKKKKSAKTRRITE